MSVKLNLLRKLVRELIKRELEEATMTGNIDGGAGPPKTPKAFKKKKKGQDESGFQDGHVDPTVSTSYRKVKESVNEAIAKDVPFNNFDWPADKNKIKKLASKYGLKVVKVSQGPNYEPTAVLKGDEKKLIKFLTGKDYGVDDEDAQDMIESINESRVSVAKEGKLEPFAKAAIKQLQNLISFHKKGKNEKARQMSRDVYTELEYMGMAFKVLGESININGKKYKRLNENNQSWAKYYSWRNDKSMTPKQKIGMSMREVRDSLQELEKIVFRSIKLKKELKVGSDNYWKSTHSALRRIHERLVKLTGKIASLY